MVKKNIDEPIEEQEEEEIQTDDEKQQIAGIAERLHNVMQMLEEKTKFTTALELFNINKLKIITRLDKSHIDTLTKFETYIESQDLIYGEDTRTASDVVVKMIRSYETNQISKDGKSRKEVVDILKDSYSGTDRDSIKRLTGQK